MFTRVKIIESLVSSLDESPTRRDSEDASFGFTPLRLRGDFANHDAKCCIVNANHGTQRGVLGRGAGVGRDLGIGVGLGVAVGVSVGVGVGVGVIVGVGVGVAVCVAFSSALLRRTKPIPCPPATSTVPLSSKLAVCSARAVLRLHVAVQVSSAGSYSSALLRETKPVANPAATSTLPLGNKLAV